MFFINTNWSLNLPFISPLPLYINILLYLKLEDRHDFLPRLFCCHREGHRPKECQGKDMSFQD